MRTLNKILKNKKDDIYVRIIPSLLCICISMACLAGSTWAWFTANKSIKVQNLSAASFTVNAVVTDSNNNTITATDGNYVLTPGKYSVTLENNGTATKGFCTVNYDNSSRKTQIFSEKLEFNIETDRETVLSFVSSWGSYNDATTMDLNNEIISDGYTLIIGEFVLPEPIEFNFDGIDEYIDWNPVTDREDGMPYPGKDYSVYFAAKSGYELGDITVDIDGVVYTVSTKTAEPAPKTTDSIPQPTASPEITTTPDVTTEPTATPEIETTPKLQIVAEPVFNPETGILTIPAQLLTENTKQLIISVTAVETEPEVTPTTEPTATPTPSAEPTVTPSASTEPTITPTASTDPAVTPSASATPGTEPTPTADPSEQPTVTPQPSPDKSAQPVPTTDITPVPSQNPTITPDPTDVPDNTTNQLETSDTQSTPEPTVVAESTPGITPAPTPTPDDVPTPSATPTEPIL